MVIEVYVTCHECGREVLEECLIEGYCASCYFAPLFEIPDADGIYHVPAPRAFD